MIPDSLDYPSRDLIQEMPYMTEEMRERIIDKVVEAVKGETMYSSFVGMSNLYLRKGRYPVASPVGEVLSSYSDREYDEVALTITVLLPEGVDTIFKDELLKMGVAERERQAESDKQKKIREVEEQMEKLEAMRQELLAEG